MHCDSRHLEGCCGVWLSGARVGAEGLGAGGEFSFLIRPPSAPPLPPLWAPCWEEGMAVSCSFFWSLSTVRCRPFCFTGSLTPAGGLACAAVPWGGASLPRRDLPGGRGACVSSVHREASFAGGGTGWEPWGPREESPLKGASLCYCHSALKHDSSGTWA